MCTSSTVRNLYPGPSLSLSATDASVITECTSVGNNVIVVPNNLHHLNSQTGEHPAAMQRGGRLLLSHPLAVPLVALVPLLLDRWLALR